MKFSIYLSILLGSTPLAVGMVWAPPVVAQSLIQEAPNPRGVELADSKLGGPITPSKNPFAEPYDPKQATQNQPKPDPQSQERPLVIQRDQNARIQLEPFQEKSEPAPYFDEQQGYGVQVLRVGR